MGSIHNDRDLIDISLTVLNLVCVGTFFSVFEEMVGYITYYYVILKKRTVDNQEANKGASGILKGMQDSGPEQHLRMQETS